MLHFVHSDDCAILRHIKSKSPQVPDVLIFLPVLGGVIELDQPGVELLNQDSDDVHEQQKVDLKIIKGRQKMSN